MSYQQLMQGIQQKAPNLVLMLAGQTYSGSQVLSILRSLIAAETTVVAQKEAWQHAVQAKTGMATQYAPLITGIRQTLRVMYGPTEPALEAFGIKPTEPRKRLSTAEIAVRTAKATATRRERLATRPEASASARVAAAPPARKTVVPGA